MIWSRCSVCGKPRQQYAGSKLATHAVCASSPELQDDVLVVIERFSPRLTQGRLAWDLGITVGVLRAWLSAALRRRAERRAS